MALKEQLFHIENVAYAGLSASGKGFFLIIPIAFPKRHKEQFAAIQWEFPARGWPWIRLRRMWLLSEGTPGIRMRFSGIGPGRIENG